MKNSAIARMLVNLDSNQLKDLRKEFNSNCNESLHLLQEKERAELIQFVDGLRLDRSYPLEAHNAVSIREYGISREHRQALHDISSTISRAFENLKELKLEVAREARRNGFSFSKCFYTTVRRMNKYKENNGNW